MEIYLPFYFFLRSFLSLFLASLPSSSHLLTFLPFIINIFAFFPVHFSSYDLVLQIQVSSIDCVGTI